MFPGAVTEGVSGSGACAPGLDLEWEGWEGQNKNGSLSVTSTPKPQLSILQGSKGKDGRPGRAPTVADQQRPRLLGVF